MPRPLDAFARSRCHGREVQLLFSRQIQRVDVRDQRRGDLENTWVEVAWVERVRVASRV